MVMGGESNEGGRLYNLLSIVRLHAWSSFWRVLLHFVDKGLMETIRVYIMSGVWYPRRSWACLVT
jgi:hypothetical protein